MIGADELTTLNKFWSPYHIRRGANAQKEINEILAMYAAAGFEVRGNQIVATNDQISSMTPPKK